MNPLPFILLAISLPLLLGGCGENPEAETKPEEPVAETKPKPEGVKKEELEFREGVVYLKGSDTPYTGKVYSLHPNGQKEGEINFKNGKGDGLQVSWHENGQKRGEGNFKNGEEDGLIVKWYENGQKAAEANFKDGKLDGLYLEWHENGQKERELNYKDGEEDGLIVKWHENGQKRSEGNYKNGKPVEGSEKFWNSKGEPVATAAESRK